VDPLRRHARVQPEPQRLGRARGARRRASARAGRGRAAARRVACCGAHCSGTGVGRSRRSRKRSRSVTIATRSRCASRCRAATRPRGCRRSRTESAGSASSRVSVGNKVALAPARRGGLRTRTGAACKGVGHTCAPRDRGARAGPGGRVETEPPTKSSTNQADPRVDEFSCECRPGPAGATGLAARCATTPPRWARA
jgi:hypothetical protein